AEAALVRSVTVNGVTEAIAAGVLSIEAQNPSYPGQLGYGRIDLMAAVSYQASSGTQTPASRDTTRYIVTFNRGTDKPSRAAAASRRGASVRFNYDVVDAIAIEVPSAAVAGMM